MIQHISADRIANSLVMDRTFSGIFLLVEGVRDQAFFRKFTKSDTCQISVAHGKYNVLGAVEILNNRSFNRVLGVIDRDFDDILNTTHTLPNIVVTDFHDIEIAILESPAIDNVIETHADAEKLKQIKQSKGPIKDVLYSLATPLAYLKLANRIHELGLVFKPEKPDGNSLSYSEFIDVKNFSYLNDDSMIKTVFNYSINRSKGIKPKDVIKQKFEEESTKHGLDLRHLCNGHDITHIIQLGLKKKLGNLNSNECSQKRIELDLIFAYDSSAFVTTTLYTNIKFWEANRGVQILNV